MEKVSILKSLFMNVQDVLYLVALKGKEIEKDNIKDFR